jgi:hypothetical protein
LTPAAGPGSAAGWRPPTGSPARRAGRRTRRTPHRTSLPSTTTSPNRPGITSMCTTPVVDALRRHVGGRQEVPLFPRIVLHGAGHLLELHHRDAAAHLLVAHQGADVGVHPPHPGTNPASCTPRALSNRASSSSSDRGKTVRPGVCRARTAASAASARAPAGVRARDSRAAALAGGRAHRHLDHGQAADSRPDPAERSLTGGTSLAAMARGRASSSGHAGQQHASPPTTGAGRRRRHRPSALAATISTAP